MNTHRIVNLKFLLCFICFLTFSNMTTSQKMILHEDYIIYESKTYSIDQLDSIFALNTDAYTHYLGYKKKLNTTTGAKITGLILGATSIGSIIIFKSALAGIDNLDIINAFFVVVGSGVLAIGTAIGSFTCLILSESSEIDAKNHLNKAIDFMNQELGSLEKEKTPVIGLGFSSGGLGLTYSF